MADKESLQGVSTCYVFKSRLQEYAQKVGLPTPVYETIKEGPSHEPTFRSTVIVNDTRYSSLPGFFNRKAAEQSAAEVALMNLPDSGLAQPVHETGLCKNLLQDYAQKMNFAIPQYLCRSNTAQSKNAPASFSCTVNIGGMEYIGGEARTKREAEIKAARTALLAIQSSGPGPDEKHNDDLGYTVVPVKKNMTDLGISNQESAAALKTKQAQFKKKKRNVNKVRAKRAGGKKVEKSNQAEPELHENAAVGNQGTECIPAPTCNNLAFDEQKTTLMVDHNNYGSLSLGINEGDMTNITGVGLVTSEVDSSVMRQGDCTSCFVADADQSRSTNIEAETS